ncbi:MAG: TonB-dependent receptor [Bacteroidales bacterium]|jgi:outer membrane receptor protein involved in Fe transport|nr:TonB-dependent receptor [Bacteroidales bacterium]
MRKFTLLMMLFLGTCLSGFTMLQAQTGTIEGTVTDAQNKETLVGATIQIKGTLTGAITDLDGKYVIADVGEGTYQLVASFVGYSTKTIEVAVVSGQKTVINFALATDLMGLDEVVVTGLVNEKSALRSADALTSLKPKFLDELGFQTTAEIFKAIPGIHVESSGGEGNANISVRGIPVASGGSKFLLLQEDGLPILQFGDISFGNADIFLRYDKSVSRIEALKGGSASTLASNSPAGIINFISKTGVEEGGVVATTFGVDFKSLRTDFDFGGSLGNGFRFNVGGFFRSGQGPRKPGFTANYGGQIKANLTKQFDKGYARIYLKYLNDKAISYMPMPVKATGTADNPTYESIEGFDLTHNTLQSPGFLLLHGVDQNGNRRTSNISDGMHPKVLAIGAEFDFEIGNGWRIKDRARMAFTKGTFNSPFPAQVASADDIAKNLAGEGYTMSYANGSQAGVPLTPAEIQNLNGNGLAMQIITFDVEMNNLNNFTNDIFLTKDLGKAKITVGYYNAYQKIAMSWLWQTYLTDVNGDDGPRLMNVQSADSSFYTDNGLVAHGVPMWGNCCTRGYDMAYTIDAPYANVEVELTSQFSMDASLRYDMGNANGYYLSNYQAAVDVDEDGIISPTEESVTLLNNAKPNTVNYNFGYVSYSIGANYLLDETKAVYARYSQGGRANADRLLYSPFIDADGKTISGLSADQINQAELGFKFKSPRLGFTATGFYDVISEQNEEFGKVLNKDYNTYGVEVDAVATFSNFYIAAGATYTKAKITKSMTVAEEGNVPRRVPALMYDINPSYSFLKGKANIGFSLIGTTKVYAQDDNVAVLPGFVYVNAFVSYNITKGLDLMINSNNVTNTLGFTEMEGDPFVDNSVNYMRARPITGRATTATISYTF